MKKSVLFRIVVGSVVGLVALAAWSQARPPTTEQLGRDPGALRQEAEQQRAQERAQQQQNSRQQADQNWNDTVRQNQSRAAADSAQGEAVRRTWQQRPALAPDHNPLLGRWESISSGQRPAAAAGLPPELAKMASELIGGMTAGLCDSMLGRGTIEFRPTGPVAIRSDGREQPMYRAEYRGGGSRVVVLPQGGTTFTHMIIDFSGPDRATVAAVGCGLRRVGGGGARPMETALATDARPVDGSASERWTPLGTSPMDGNPELYVARSSVRRSGSLAKMVELWDFKGPRAIGGKTVVSVRSEFEYDCVASRKRLLSATGYSKHMGQGVVVASESLNAGWSEVPTSGALHDTLKAACTRP